MIKDTTTLKNKIYNGKSVSNELILSLVKSN